MDRPSNNSQESTSRPVRANYLITGVTCEEVFAALLEVDRFTEWSYGLRRSRILGDASEVVPGTILQFGLSALGLTHEVTSEIITVEAPRLLEWRYVGGAVGNGGWLLEEAGPSAVRMTLRNVHRLPRGARLARPYSPPSIFPKRDHPRPAPHPTLGPPTFRRATKGLTLKESRT